MVLCLFAWQSSTNFESRGHADRLLFCLQINGTFTFLLSFVFLGKVGATLLPVES